MVNNRVAKEVANDIVNDQMKVLQKTIEYMAKKTSEDWERMARKVMDDYYSDYDKTTQKYNRTFEMRQKIITPVLKQDGFNWEAGVKFDVFGTMDHELEDFDEISIFQNFMHGHHGNKNYTVPTTGEQIKRNIYISPTPAKEVLDMYYKNYDRKIEEYFEDGLKLALLDR